AGGTHLGRRQLEQLPQATSCGARHRLCVATRLADRVAERLAATRVRVGGEELERVDLVGALRQRRVDHGADLIGAVHLDAHDVADHVADHGWILACAIGARLRVHVVVLGGDLLLRNPGRRDGGNDRLLARVVLPRGSRGGRGPRLDADEDAGAVGRETRFTRCGGHDLGRCRCRERYRRASVRFRRRAEDPERSELDQRGAKTHEDLLRPASIPHGGWTGRGMVRSGGEHRWGAPVPPPLRATLNPERASELYPPSPATAARKEGDARAPPEPVPASAICLTRLPSGSLVLGDLQTASFSVLLGPTRSGTTSLLRLLAGLDRPTSGAILEDGVDVTKLDVRRRNVAMVYQEFVNYPSFTVYDNIAAPLRRARRLSA